MSQDDCVVAGLSAGGTLQTNDQDKKVVTEGSWDDKPSGCFLANGIIHYNTNPVGARGDDYIPVCHEIEVSLFFLCIWFSILSSITPPWEKTQNKMSCFIVFILFRLR